LYPLVALLAAIINGILFVVAAPAIIAMFTHAISPFTATPTSPVLPIFYVNHIGATGRALVHGAIPATTALRTKVFHHIIAPIALFICAMEIAAISAKTTCFTMYGRATPSNAMITTLT
jgi:hypothetical protein